MFTETKPIWYVLLSLQPVLSESKNITLLWLAVAKDAGRLGFAHCLYLNFFDGWHSSLNAYSTLAFCALITVGERSYKGHFKSPGGPKQMTKTVSVGCVCYCLECTYFYHWRTLLLI